MRQLSGEVKEFYKQEQMVWKVARLMRLGKLRCDGCFSREIGCDEFPHDDPDVCKQIAEKLKEIDKLYSYGYATEI